MINPVAFCDKCHIEVDGFYCLRRIDFNSYPYKTAFVCHDCYHNLEKEIFGVKNG